MIKTPNHCGVIIMMMIMIIIITLLLVFMVRITLFPMLSLLYFYISTFPSMCAVPNMAVFCNSLISNFPVCYSDIF